MRVTRRGFISVLGGATAASAALARGRLTRADAGLQEVERWATPEEMRAPAICQQCPGGCGLMVRSFDGRVGGIAGNPLHPINRGAVCAKAFGALQLVHADNRVTSPLKRDGQGGRLRPTDWDDAMRLLTARLGDLRAKGLAHTVAILGGQYRGYRDVVWRRFAEAYGTPNYIRVRCFAPEEPALAHRLMQGVAGPQAYDLEETRCILSFGVGLLESWAGPVHASLAITKMRSGIDRPRGRLIQVDPRRSHTAMKADRWVPIVPGTDGILALGIANALIREGLYDREFVERHTFGFEEWADPDGRRHEGFKDVVLSDYGLLTVSRATGVPVRTIIEIAREVATVKPAVVIGERGPASGPEDLHTRMAIHSLNALVGSIGARGGFLPQLRLPLAPLPAVQQDEAAKLGRAAERLDGAGRGKYLLVANAPQALPRRILAADPYPVNAVLLFATNPLANHPARDDFAAALERVPFVVSFSPFLDETTARADLVLPDHTFLERWQDDHVAHLARFSCFSVARPAVAPVHATRDTMDVVLELGKSLGGSVAASLPWETFDKVLHAGARGLWDVRRGHVVSTPAEESLRNVLERQGYWMPEFKSYDEFWDALVARGAWWDPTGLPSSRKALLATKTGKFEFYSTALRQQLDQAGREGHPLLAALSARGDRVHLPVVPVRMPEERPGFPLRLNTYRAVTRPQGGGANQPWLLEQPVVHVRASWTRWVEVHPDVAGNAGIKDGDRVWVESARGRIALLARLSAGSRSDVVNVPLFAGEGASQNDILANEADVSRGFGLLNTTRVKVYKA